MRIAVVVLAAALTAACAAPDSSGYVASIRVLASTATTAHAVLTEAQARAGVARQSEIWSEALEGFGSVYRVGSKCTVTSADCEVWFIGDGETYDLHPKSAPLIAIPLDALSLVTGYLHALERVATATDRAEIDGNAVKMLQAADVIFDLANFEASNNEYMEPPRKVAILRARETKNASRMAVLEIAVAEMQATLDAAAEFFSGRGKEPYENHIETMVRRFEAAERAWQDGIKTRADLAAYVAAGAALDVAYLVRLGPMFRKLADSHRALKDAIADPNAPREKLIDGVAAFAVYVNKAAARLRRTSTDERDAIRLKRE
jgi:hypothetical protein